MLCLASDRIPVTTCTSGPLPFMAHPSDQSQAVLLAVGQLLGREIALDDLVSMLVDRIVESMHADRGTLYLLDPIKNELFSKAAHLPELKEIRLAIGQGIAGHVAKTGEVVNVPSTRKELRFYRDIDQKTGYTSHSIIAAPLKDRRGRIFGVVQVLNRKGGNFTRDDEKTLLTLVDQAALALEATSLYQELRRAETDPVTKVSYHYNRIIGDGEAMSQVYRAIDKAASTSATVLIRGESGTGKELIARAVQVNSPRRNKPFIKVDCAALPASLIENELFGHEKGAFTGAVQRTIGKFEAAHGGTLFIDELGELPLSVQGKLLRVIQDREFERVGGTETLKVDVRIVAATNRDLESLVEAGRFRADLYYRVRVVEVFLPPLRARGHDDIHRLIQHFVSASAQRHGLKVPIVTDMALARLLAYPWPGNVRELEHCIESAVVMADLGRIDAEGLPLPSRVPNLPAGGSRLPMEEGFGEEERPLPVRSSGPIPRPRATLPPIPTRNSGQFQVRDLLAAHERAQAQAAAAQEVPAGSGFGAQMPSFAPSAWNSSGPIPVSSPFNTPGGSTPPAAGTLPLEFEDEENVLSLAEVERRHILQVLGMAGNNRTVAARLLQIGRNTLGRKLKEYGLEDGEG